MYIYIYNIYINLLLLYLIRPFSPTIEIFERFVFFNSNNEKCLRIVTILSIYILTLLSIAFIIVAIFVTDISIIILIVINTVIIIKDLQTEASS